MNDDVDDKLYAILSRVQDEATFLDFLLALSRDWEDEQWKERVNPSSPYGPGANGWENGDIGQFLGAAHAWGTAFLHSGDCVEERANGWRRAAAIIYAGRYYE